jgi:GMP synthase (glutamine-hydrolysing)
MLRLQILVDGGFFADLTELDRHAGDLAALDANRRRRDIAWRLGLDHDISSDAMRQIELANWIARQVRV